MATLKEQLAVIGKSGSIFVGGLTVNVTIEDYKNSYGKDRWLVKPVSGEGKVWVEWVTVTDHE